MKYAFDKFKIELIPKVHENQTLNRNSSYSLGVDSAKRRQSHTAEVNRRRRSLHAEEQINYQVKRTTKEVDYICYPFTEAQRLSKSQTLKQNNVCVIKEKNKRKHSWLKSQNPHEKHKQEEYKAFQEKCIDLLCKKKSERKDTNDNNPPAEAPLNKSQLSPQKLINLTKPHTVHDMMNNIIQRFKKDTKLKNYASNPISKDIQAENYQSKCKNESFRTRNMSGNFNSGHSKKASLTNQDQKEILEMIRSAELRRNQSVSATNKPATKTELEDRLDKEANSYSTRFDFEQKQISEQLERNFRSSINPNQEEQQYLNSNILSVDNKNLKAKTLLEGVPGIKISRRLLNTDAMAKANPIVCMSIPLNEQTAIKKAHLNSFSNHINLSPAKTVKRKKIQLNRPNKKLKFMKFAKNVDEQYNKKIKSFLDFLFKVNFSNNIYVSLQLASIEDTIVYHKYKVYVGGGNNSLLIKSLLKRRPWLQIVDNFNEEGIQFYWSQNKFNQIHQKQSKCQNFRKGLPTQSKVERKQSPLKSHACEHNQKLMFKEKSELVQGFISKDGFQIPFEAEYQPTIVTNHLPQNQIIGSKKNLFKSLSAYYTNITHSDPFKYIPKTYHIKSLEDPEYKRFFQDHKKQPNRIWIVKPGENSNRGNGIRLSKFYKIETMIKQNKAMRHENGQLQTYVIQSYINRPFLYNGRKFDVRHFVLATSVNGIMKLYWYRDGYLRTSSEHYDIEDVDNQMIHLTNDAIQQKGQDYGRYEEANKVSYSEFQRYLDHSHTNRNLNFEVPLRTMKEVITDVFKASYLNMDRQRRQDNFEIFGFDFMLDRDFNPYLIEINFNPCLIMNCGLLNRIIPPMIENSLRLGLDPLLTPKCHLPVNKRNSLSENYLKNLRYELIFDEASLQNDIFNKVAFDDSDGQDEEEEFCDNGKELPENFTF